MIVLVDLDNTIADFEGNFIRNWRARYPHLPHIPREERKNFYQTKDYPAEHTAKVKNIIVSEGFFCDLEPVPGAINALHAMLDMDWEVHICTSSYYNYVECVRCKYAWVLEHLGQEWQKRTIIASDKTLVRGDVLIDDRPYIKGNHTPVWEYILFDQPYNRQVTEFRRLDWSNWREVLMEVQHDQSQRRALDL
jgi:5'-nucleotidase